MSQVNNTAVQGRKSLVQRIGGQKIIVFLVVVVLFAFFSLMSENFRKTSTIIQILDFSYYITLMSIGVTFPLITGGVDLSIGTGMICYALAGGYLYTKLNDPTNPNPALALVAIGVALAFGILVGLFNGVLVSRMGLPPFLATLCTCMMTRGLGSLVANNSGVTWPGMQGEGFRGVFRILVPHEGGRPTIFPLGILWILLLVLLMEFVLKKTKVGRYTIAIGSNKEAATLSGINVKFYHMMAYVISGFFAGLAAVAYSAIIPTVQPGTGAGFELEAIGGAIIGGVSATGGAGSIIGSFLGVFVICLLKTGLPFIGLQANWQQIITGLVLIGAVMVDIVKARYKKS